MGIVTIKNRPGVKYLYYISKEGNLIEEIHSEK